MNGFDDSLRGYSYRVHLRDGFVCQYCGLDGRESLDHWLAMSLEHLVPKTDKRRDDPEFQTTACQFCNTADNQYFNNLESRGLSIKGMTREELIAQRKQYVLKRRRQYCEFWNERVT